VQPKPRQLKIHGTNEQNDVIGTMSKQVCIGKEFTLFKNERIEEQFRLSTATRKVSEMITTRETQIVQIQFGNISFENVPRDEPLYGLIEFYNIKKGEKVSETFAFELPIENPRESTTLTFQYVEKPSRDLYIVIWIERTLGDQSLEKLIVPYLARPERKSRTQQTQQREVVPHLKGIRQKILFTFAPVYENSDVDGERWDEPVTTAPPVHTYDPNRRKSVFDIFKISKKDSTPPTSPPKAPLTPRMSSTLTRGSSGLGSFGNAGSFRETPTTPPPHRNSRSGSVSTPRSISINTPMRSSSISHSPPHGSIRLPSRASTVITTGSVRVKSSQTQPVEPQPTNNTITNRKSGSVKEFINRLSIAFTGRINSESSNDHSRLARTPSDDDSTEEESLSTGEDLALREGKITFTQFYPVPLVKDFPNQDTIGRHHRHVSTTFDVCQFIQHVTTGKLVKHASGSLNLVIKNVTSATVNKMSERVTHQVRMRQIQSNEKDLQLLNFGVLKKPIAQISYIHNLYIYPERLDAMRYVH
jgi:hypothetical protein